MHEGDLLKRRIKGLGKTMEEAAKELDISRTTLYTHLGSTQITDLNFLQNVKEVFNIDIKDYVDTINRIPKQQKPDSLVVNTPPIGYSKQQSIFKADHTLTYLPMSAMAGFLSVVKDMSPDIEQQFEQVRLPDYNHCDTVIEIDGDSMYPTFSSKDQVICKRKESMRYIETGKPYVINVDGEFVIKRIFDHQQPEKIILRSDNPYYPDQIIEREWIKAIFKIHGVISNNTGERKIIRQGDIN